MYVCIATYPTPARNIIQTPLLHGMDMRSFLHPLQSTQLTNQSYPLEAIGYGKTHGKADQNYLCWTPLVSLYLEVWWGLEVRKSGLRRRGIDAG